MLVLPFISHRVRNSCLTKRLFSFGALIAFPAMLATAWRDAGESNFQRQMLSASDDLRFSETAKRNDDFQLMTERARRESLELSEKLRRRVGEWIVIERRERDGRDFAKRAKNGGFGEQQQIASWQIHGGVGCARVRHFFSSLAPMFVIHVVHRQRDDVQRRDVWRAESAQEFSQPEKLRVFPCESFADEHGKNLSMRSRQFRKKDATVESAANENADG